jgi:hypothetical protein
MKEKDLLTDPVAFAESLKLEDASPFEMTEFQRQLMEHYKGKKWVITLGNKTRIVDPWSYLWAQSTMRMLMREGEE